MLKCALFLFLMRQLGEYSSMQAGKLHHGIVSVPEICIADTSLQRVISILLWVQGATTDNDRALSKK